MVASTARRKPCDVSALYGWVGEGKKARNVFKKVYNSLLRGAKVSNTPLMRVHNVAVQIVPRLGVVHKHTSTGSQPENHRKKLLHVASGF